MQPLKWFPTDPYTSVKGWHILRTGLGGLSCWPSWKPSGSKQTERGRSIHQEKSLVFQHVLSSPGLGRNCRLYCFVPVQVRDFMPGTCRTAPWSCRVSTLASTHCHLTVPGLEYSFPTKLKDSLISKQAGRAAGQESWVNYHSKCGGASRPKESHCHRNNRIKKKVIHLGYNIFICLDLRGEENFFYHDIFFEWIWV